MNSPSKRRIRQRLRRARAVGRNTKVVVSEYPKFLVKLVGWRKVWLARTETKPGYRHD